MQCKPDSIWNVNIRLTPFTKNKYKIAGPKFRYKYAAVSPWDGYTDFMTTEMMNTVSISLYLEQVSMAHSEEFIIMVADDASSVGPSIDNHFFFTYRFTRVSRAAMVGLATRAVSFTGFTDWPVMRRWIRIA